MLQNLISNCNYVAADPGGVYFDAPKESCGGNGGWCQNHLRTGVTAVVRPKDDQRQLFQFRLR